jgi:COPI associated protein
MGDENAGMPSGGGVVPPAAPEKTTIRNWSKTKLLRVLRVFNMLNGLTMIATAILVFFVSIVSISFTSLITSGLVCFFGILLTCLECNILGIAPKLRKNFGFVFSFWGRAVFIVFCGSMVMALSYWLAYIIGGVTMLNGFFNGFVICVHPAFRTGELSATNDPFGGYTGGEEEFKNFLKSRPDLANKVGAAAMSAAASNPELAMKVATSAAASKDANANPWA